MSSRPEHILLAGIVGSNAYGMNHEASDVDIKGVCVADHDVYLGLRSFEQYENPDQDEVIYELKKFVRLALSCNPSVIELLWLPEYLVQSEQGARLVEMRYAFLSKRAHRTFSGYAIAQIKKCKQKIDDPECKAGIKAKNPYKHAAHCLRLLRMGREILVDGNIQVNRTGIDADELLAIRKGERDINEVLAEAEDMLVQLYDVAQCSILPDEPDTEVVQRVMADIIWDHLRACRHK